MSLEKEMRDALIKSLKKFLQGNLEKHKTNIEVYLNQSVGIGEHSKILDEIHIWTAKLSEANENLESLKKYFDDYGDVKDNNKTKKLLND